MFFLKQKTRLPDGDRVLLFYSGLLPYSLWHADFGGIRRMNADKAIPTISAQVRNIRGIRVL